MKGLDSSSSAIMSKVHAILLNCKELKSGNGDDDVIGRSELSSKWISLLTMEKACLSTVSFEGKLQFQNSLAQLSYGPQRELDVLCINSTCIFIMF